MPVSLRNSWCSTWVYYRNYQAFVSKYTEMKGEKIGEAGVKAFFENQKEVQLREYSLLEKALY